MKKNQHVIPYKKGSKAMWAIKTAGKSRNTAIVETQREAIERAKKIAKNNKSELLIHKKDGLIKCRSSFVE